MSDGIERVAQLAAEEVVVKTTKAIGWLVETGALDKGAEDGPVVVAGVLREVSKAVVLDVLTRLREQVAKEALKRGVIVRGTIWPDNLCPN